MTSTTPVGPARALDYLAVHDLVWINNTIAGKTLPFNYAALEEAMAAQYSYGRSTDVLGQAANLLSTFLRKRPFQYGNARTGFVALAAFLNANGYTVGVSDEEAAKIVQAAERGEMTGPDAMSALARATEGLGPRLSLRALVSRLLNQHADAVRRLAAGDAAGR